MTGASIETTLELWASSLREVKKRMRPLFEQDRTALNAGLFVDGLLGDERRKTGWMRAEAAGDPGPWRQQALLGRDQWDADGLRDMVRDYVTEHLGDRPLGFHWHTPNLPYAPAYNSIITEAVQAAEEGKSVSYSRNKNFYRDTARYRGTAYTYDTVLSAVADGVRGGWLEEWRQRPGSNRKWQSTFWATSALLEAWDVSAAPVFEQRETIRLRDDDGELIGYPETDETTRMRCCRSCRRTRSRSRPLSFRPMAT